MNVTIETYLKEITTFVVYLLYHSNEGFDRFAS